MESPRTTPPELIKEIWKILLEDDELFRLSAELTKKTFDALVKAGFTPEQAIEIVAHQGAIKMTN